MKSLALIDFRTLAPNSPFNVQYIKNMKKWWKFSEKLANFEKEQT